MRYHTTDPGKRAESIADREAEKRCNELEDQGPYFKLWLEIKEQVLKEFAPQC